MKRTLFLALGLFALISCQAVLEEIPTEVNSDSQSEISETSTVYHASTESYSQPETRIYADENMKVLWNADDRISIFENTTYNYQYKFLGEDGETAGDFDKVTSSGFHTGNNVDYVYAAYPYRTSNKLSNSGVFTMVLPAEQYYKENSFGIGSNSMVAVSDGTFLAFKNVCGYLSISLYGDNVSVSKFTIQGKNGEKIAGKASISIPFGGLPTTTMDGTATESITIECNPALKIGSSSSECTTFWFAIPPVTFTKGITLTIEDDKGGVCTKSASKEIKIERNKLSKMNALEVKPKYSIVSFDDQDFESYCVSNFDKNGDNLITADEASAVTSIDVCTDNITSLGGVESFTNLESLKCTGSGVATKSSSEYNGQLESLDVSALTLLKELDCRDNQLQTLDVSGNPELETLICTENPMSEIKMAVGQEISDLECPEDTEIVYEWGDGIGPESFPDVVFRDFVFVNFDTDGDGFLSEEECDAVTSIDVVTDEIESLEGVEFFPNLESLFACASTVHNDYVNGCYGTGVLKSLDVSNNLLLKGLRVEGNKLTSIDVSKNIKLEYIHINANLLTELDLSHNGELKNLQCIGNNLSGLDLSGNPKITGLGCVSCGLTSLDLSANTELQNVACSYNQLSNLDVSNCTALKGLSVTNNCLTNLDVSSNTELTFILCSNNLLTSLDVTRNTALATLWCFSNPNLATVYVNAGQEINISKDDATEIIYVQPANEIWYTTSDREAVTYTVASDTGNELDESLCKAPKDNDGVGIIRFTAPITTIDNKGLEKQKNLTSITLPDGVETIGASAFEYCSSLSEVHYGSSLKTIGAWAFGHTNLGDIDFLPEGLVRIGAGAFEACPSTTVVIPESVKYLGTSTRGEFPMGNPFYNCDNIKSFVGKFATVDGKALVETAPDGKTYFISYAVARDDDSYVVPEVDAISYFAFWDATSLKQIELPSGLEAIYDAAFLACISLENITIPSGVQLIGGDAFVNCRNMQWVRIESSSVPSGRAQYYYYEGGMFRCSSGYTYDIYVPSSSVEAYKAADYWSDFADRIKPLASLPEAVDLGLSVKWASFNLGASNPEEYGDYYAWGETQPYYEPGYAQAESPVWKSGKNSGYAWDSYKFNPSGDGQTFTKYTGNDHDNLQLEDDAASINLGGGWRIPTESEVAELFDPDKCDWQWIENYNNSGTNGYLINSKIEGYTDKSIFLPASGSRAGTVRENFGSTGCYYASAIDGDPNSALGFSFRSSHKQVNAFFRWGGCSVRPVSN